MKNEEAKFILSAYRANGGDAADPMFQEAMKQAQADPELRDWFARKQRYDSAVAAKLGQIAPPPGLRDSILAGGRVTRSQRSIRRTVSWFVVAAAAALAITSGLMLWANRGGAEALAKFAINDTAFAEHGSHGDLATELQAKLSEPSTRLSKGLALDFEKLRTTGCRTLSVGRAEVLEVCFKRDGSWFHLYVARGEALGGAGTKELLLKQDNKFCCATWVDHASGYRYAVVSDSGMDAVKSLL